MKEKKIIYTGIVLLSALLALMTLLLLGGCTEYDMAEEAGEREVNVRINITTHDANPNIAGTRATVVDETVINNALVLVYNASQVYEKKGNISGAGLTLTLREGMKYIFVVANPCPDLLARLNSTPPPTYTALMDMVSEAADYNAGNYPIHGLLMSGTAEKTISTNSSNNTVEVKLSYCTARIDLYIRKGSSDVDNITLSKVELKNARSMGYLFKDAAYDTGTTNNTLTLLSNQINTYTAGSDGTLVGTQYAYPATNAGDLAFQITLRHANALTQDTYTVYPNAANSASPGSTLKRGRQYKVIVTFSKDEQSNLNVSAYTTINNDFVIG